MSPTRRDFLIGAGAAGLALPARSADPRPSRLTTAFRSRLSARAAWERKTHSPPSPRTAWRS